MIPLGDDRLHNVRKPIIAVLLIILNVLVFLFEVQLSDEELNAFIYTFGATPAYIQNGENTLSLLTSMFLHGGWMHLIGNMLFLWVFGDNIEAVLGHFGFLLFYLIGGLAATAAHIFFNLGSEIPSVGASGAISACLGAYLVMSPHSRVRTLIPIGSFITTMRVSAWVFLGVWIIIQVVSSTLGSGGEEGGGVAWWAHIGGFVFGVLAGFLYRSKAQTIVVIQDDVNRRWF